MQQEYWHARWDKNEIGFHCSEVNPFLQKYFKKIPLASPSRVLVPLCGKSLDLLWLANQGLYVSGCELSSIACEQFFTENNLTIHQEKSGAYVHYSHQQISIWCGDFFALTKSDLGSINFCYDRAALIALPPKMRPSYVVQIKNLLDQHAYYLLINISYSSDEPLGPPFSITDKEIRQLFSEGFTICHLESQIVPIETVTTLAKKGARDLINHVYLLQRV